MYQVSDSAALGRAFTRERAQPAVRRTVILLGLTSLLTDISSEMVVTILPLYLVAVGGFSPLAFGVIDGIYNGATAIVRLASGYIGDRFKRHKEVAATGYGLSAICKLALVLVGTAVSSIAAVVLHRPVREGHPDGAARRDDLARDAERAARHGVRRAPCDGHRRGDDRPAARVRRCSPSRRSPSTRSSSSPSASRSSGSRSSSCS